MSRKPSAPSSNPLAGGAPLALLIVIGVVVGGIYGQPTIGLLIGLAIGVVLALIIWQKSRPKS